MITPQENLVYPGKSPTRIGPERGQLRENPLRSSEPRRLRMLFSAKRSLNAILAAIAVHPEEERCLVVACIS